MAAGYEHLYAEVLRRTRQRTASPAR
jgi:hypothetical protein